MRDRERKGKRAIDKDGERKGLPSLFVVPGGVSSQLEHLSRQIFHHGGEIHRCTGANAFCIVAFPEKTMDSSHGELQPCPAAAGLRLSLGLTWKEGHAGWVAPVARRRCCRNKSSWEKKILSFTYRLCHVQTCFTELNAPAFSVCREFYERVTLTHHHWTLKAEWSCSSAQPYGYAHARRIFWRRLCPTGDRLRGNGRAIVTTTATSPKVPSFSRVFYFCHWHARGNAIAATTVVMPTTINYSNAPTHADSGGQTGGIRIVMYWRWK